MGWPALDKLPSDASITTKINVPHSASLNGLDPWTTGGWVRHNGVGGSNRHFIAKGNGTSNNRRIYFGRALSTGLIVALDGTTDLDYRTVAGCFPRNVWTFVAATFWSARTTPDRVKIYAGTDYRNFGRIPAATAATDGVGLFGDPGTAVELMNSGASSDPYFGPMPFWFLSNQVLEYEELRDLMDDHRGAPIRGCVGRWYPGEYGTLTVPDHSGFGNHGTPSGLIVSPWMLPHNRRLSRRP